MILVKIFTDTDDENEQEEIWSGFMDSIPRRGEALAIHKDNEEIKFGGKVNSIMWMIFKDQRQSFVVLFCKIEKNL